MKFANLHLHSTYSDSQLTPMQLVLIGKSLGYHALALTDHETDGGVKEFNTFALKEGLQALSGIEFYGRDFGKSFHIVALDYDTNNPVLRAFVAERCRLRNECTRQCVERGISLGYIQGITWNDVVDLNGENAWLCIDSVIRAMKLKRAMDPIDSGDELRRQVFNAPEAKALRPTHPSAEQVIRVIRQAGGVAILAHPYLQTQYVEKLVNYGLNGIEISHPDNYDNTCALAIEAAKAFRLYRSGGTDHTGAMSGCNGNLAIPALQGITEEEFTTLKERRLG